MNNINLKAVKPQFMAQIIRSLRGDEAIKQAVFELRIRFGIQNRPFNKTDFLEICKSEDIHVVEDFDGVFEDYIKLRGVYFWYRFKKIAVIGINPRLSKRNYLKVAFHEIGHHFMHSYKLKTQTLFKEPLTLNCYVREAQADYFSDLMLSEVKSDEK